MSENDLATLETLNLGAIVRYRDSRRRLRHAGHLFERVLWNLEQARAAQRREDEALHKRLRRHQDVFGDCSDLLFSIDVLQAAELPPKDPAAPTEHEIEQASQHLLQAVAERLHELPYPMVRNLTRDRWRPVKVVSWIAAIVAGLVAAWAFAIDAPF